MGPKRVERPEHLALPSIQRKWLSIGCVEEMLCLRRRAAEPDNGIVRNHLRVNDDGFPLRDFQRSDESAKNQSVRRSNLFAMRWF